MEKVELLDIECSSSTHKHSNYHTTKSHKSQLHKASSSHHEGNTLGNGRQNQVCNVLLFGVPIVALLMDGKERLCLAQISSTLLKEFSYNEIHNRRVALGINCVQCTPVQLEILRRAGAMPVTSRRCGMITKREAERLCKSFLGSHAPPQLPESFAFDVFHECAWGCRGSFIPSRYNSSRAKCIRCAYCQLFFSPNKFIFHSHRLSISKYVQPDAANFNSWRRHLKLFIASNITSSSGGGIVDTTTTTNLTAIVGISDDALISTSNDVVNCNQSESDPHLATSSTTASTPEIVHAWEDVKAMFNGGTRKRLLAVHSIPSSPSKQQEKSSGLGRKNGSGSSKQQQQQRGNNNNSNGSNHHQQVVRQSQFLQQSAASGFTLQNHPSAPNSFISGQIPSTSHHQSIWNPGISGTTTSSEESRNRANNAFNDILMNAAAVAAAASSSSSASQSSSSLPQLPIHPTGISAAAVLSNSFPWFPRVVVPPLFPFSHPFGPSYKYPGESSNSALNSSAFKPIQSNSPPNRIIGQVSQQHQLPPLPLPILPFQSLSSPSQVAGGAEYNPFISSSTSWFTSTNEAVKLSGTSSSSNKNQKGSRLEGVGLPEDLSLNSAPLFASVSSSNSPSSSSSVSSRSSRSSSIEFSNLASAKVDHPSSNEALNKATIIAKEEKIAPSSSSPLCQLASPRIEDNNSVSSFKPSKLWNFEDTQRLSSGSDNDDNDDGNNDGCSEIDVTDNEEEEQVHKTLIADTNSWNSTKNEEFDEPNEMLTYHHHHSTTHQSVYHHHYKRESVMNNNNGQSNSIVKKKAKFE